MEEAKTMSRFYQEWAEKRALKFEEDLQKWCEENNIMFLVQGAEGRADLEAKYIKDFNKKEEAKRLEEIRKQEEEKQFRLEQSVKTFELSIPPRYKDANIEQLKMTEQTKKILDGASAVIVGGNGFGKTHLYYALAREWVSRGETVEIISAQELLYNIKANDCNLYDYLKAKYKTRVQHLLIDEIDKIFESKADHIYLNYIINMRYEWLLQTILVGNGTLEELKQAVGNSIVDRLTKEGGISIDCSKSDRDWRLH